MLFPQVSLLAGPVALTFSLWLIGKAGKIAQRRSGMWPLREVARPKHHIVFFIILIEDEGIGRFLKIWRHDWLPNFKDLWGTTFGAQMFRIKHYNREPPDEIRQRSDFPWWFSANFLLAFFNCIAGGCCRIFDLDVLLARVFITWNGLNISFHNASSKAEPFRVKLYRKTGYLIAKSKLIKSRGLGELGAKLECSFWIYLPRID